MARGGVNVTIDASGLVPLLRGLNQVDKALRDESSGRLRDAAGRGATALVSELHAAAAASATPQARIVVETVRVRRDRLISVAVGGAKRVGSRGTAAGAILWGSEHGGRNFAAEAGGSYWIAPAAESFRTGHAERVYLEAVTAILRDAGLA